jgi:vacuolar-type H+-ATPase subunit I/STV1
MVFVMNVPRWRRKVLCACVHPLPDCCRFYGDQLSCIDCYRKRHVIFVPHAIRDGDSSQLLAKKDTASNDVKAPPESNEKARLGEGWKNEDKNDEVEKKDNTAQDLKAAHQSDDAAEKEDDRKPVAVNKKMNNATLKIKDPPKHVDEKDETDDKKQAAKENVQDKKKRRNPKLPLHPNSTRLLQNR